MNKKYSASDIKIIKLDNAIYEKIDITKDGFKRNLRNSCLWALEYTRTIITNHLPDKLVYVVQLNSSYDSLEFSETETGEFDNQESLIREFSDENSVVEFLWLNGKVPEWINVSVCKENKESTYIMLLCCGRFTNNIKEIYLPQSGIAPFSIKSPALPPWYKEGEKFDLYWSKES